MMALAARCELRGGARQQSRFNNCGEGGRFVVARAKLNRQTKRRQLPRITGFLETRDPFGQLPSASQGPMRS